MVHSNKWLYIQACNDCGYYPSKKELDRLFPPYKPLYPNWNEKPEIEHRGGFGRNGQNK